jgi:hypothetical protein
MHISTLSGARKVVTGCWILANAAGEDKKRRCACRAVVHDSVFEPTTHSHGA